MADLTVHNNSGSTRKPDRALYVQLVWDCKRCGTSHLYEWTSQPRRSIADHRVERCGACGTPHRITVGAQVLAPKQKTAEA